MLDYGSALESESTSFRVRRLRNLMANGLYFAARSCYRFAGWVRPAWEEGDTLSCKIDPAVPCHGPVKRWSMWLYTERGRLVTKFVISACEGHKQSVLSNVSGLTETPPKTLSVSL